jgi:hypothetical protein
MLKHWTLYVVVKRVSKFTAEITLLKITELAKLKTFKVYINCAQLCTWTKNNYEEMQTLRTLGNEQF